ncbi:MAG: serine hydrolase domain-containing protein [Bacteroidota bacterium]
MKYFLVALSLIMCTPKLQAQVLQDSLNQWLSAYQQNYKVPGFAVSIVTTDSILYQNAFGYADIESQKPYTLHTLHNIGSVSKTFIGNSIMRMVQESRLKLDMNINDILPFEVNHPVFPDIPITLRDLATHTSGIRDSKIYSAKCYVLQEKITPYLSSFSNKQKKELLKLNGNKKQPLGDFLKDYLSTEGQYYKARNFTSHTPGDHYEYSNIGAALAAYIVELASGTSFDAYCQENILTPMNLKESGWSFQAVDMNQHASLYFPNQAKIPRYTLLTYPDGGMLTNCHDLSRYLQAMMKGYFKGEGILNADSYQNMMSIQFTDDDHKSGVFWDINKSNRIGHTGADPGVFSIIQFDPKTKIGMLFMTNCSIYEDKNMLNGMREVWPKMRDYSAKIHK